MYVTANMVNTKACTIPAKIPKNANNPTGIKKCLTSEDTITRIINPPKIFPNKRNECETTEDTSEIKFK